VVRDASGEVRLVFRAPAWEDFVALAVTEIRLCARESVTVYRRLQAMFELLDRALPRERAGAIEEESRRLLRTIERTLADPRTVRSPASATCRVSAAARSPRGNGGVIRVPCTVRGEPDASQPPPAPLLRPADHPPRHRPARPDDTGGRCGVQFGGVYF